MKAIQWRYIFFLALITALFFATDSHAFTLQVVDENGAAITGGYRYLIEEDTTFAVTPGVFPPASTPVEQLPMSINIHRTYAPIVQEGSSPSGANSTITTDINGVALNPAKRYAISVMPLTITPGYIISGKNYKPVNIASDTVKVVLKAHPIPTAQISILVFNDIRPINNAADVPFESGLQNFRVLVFDQLGTISQDAFGNPLGTTYDNLGNVATMGTGVILTDATGRALVKNINPGKYGIRIVPCTPGQVFPDSSVCPGEPGKPWIQDNTIEGTPGIDAWVAAGEPALLVEFGPAFPHVFYGFVQPMDILASLPIPPGGSTGTITGRIVQNHSARPPSLLTYPGNPVGECWNGLNTLLGGTLSGVYVAPCNQDGTFTISNVPPGTYQLVTWDFPLDVIFNFTNVVVPSTGGVVALGDVPVNMWFGAIEGSVFYDTNQNGFRDCVTATCNNAAAGDEVGISNQVINLRFRDASIFQSTLTMANGDYELKEVFPFFKYLVQEVDYTRLKPTGLTIVVDNGGPLAPLPIYPFGSVNNPQPQPENGGLGYRTEQGPSLLEAIMTYADQTNVVNWGKVNYSPGENGGIAGIAFNGTTRAEENPRLGTAETWEVGIPRVVFNLYQDYLNNTTLLPGPDGIIDDINGTPGIQLADVDNYPFGWSDPACVPGPNVNCAKGPEDISRCSTDVGPTTIFCSGDALVVTATDSWDDNLPTGCVGPTQYVTFPGQSPRPIIDCAETMRTWNQVRPAVFDGGYAFGFLTGNNIPAGTYIVEAVPPPGYNIQKEEDRNVVFGDRYTPTPLIFPTACVGSFANTGTHHCVPNTLSLFPDAAEPTFSLTPTWGTFNTAACPGQWETPLCSMKQVPLAQGQNAAADFHMFATNGVPVSAQAVGLLTNDLAIVIDPNNPIFTEKSTPMWLPISFQDFTGNEVARVYSDTFGAYNARVPSTYTINPPIPTGVSPNMLRVCLNHPLIQQPDGSFLPDPFFDPRFSQSCYTLDFWPGKSTYLDTPLIPAAAFTGATNSTLDCEFPDGTPIIKLINNNGDASGATGSGPYVSATGTTITLYSLGTVAVPNPDFVPFVGGSATINRDYGFGATPGTVTVGGVALTGLTWSNTGITGTVPGGATTGEVVVTRGDNNKSTVIGTTLNIGGPAPTYVLPALGTPIQNAIDAAATGALIIVRPGQYLESVIMWKNVKLQGFGAFASIINAAPFPPGRLTAWTNKLNGPAGLITTGAVSTVPGEDTTFVSDTAPGILVIPHEGDFTVGTKARIDGLQIVSAGQGGGILVNGYAHYLEIANNRILNNIGAFGGGIRLGTAGLLPAAGGYQSSFNDHVNIHNNHVLENAGSGFNAGGGITLFNGSDNYSITNNFICGNFTTTQGAGISHFGLSPGGVIAFNKIVFNEATFGSATGGSGGGVVIKGEPAPLGAAGNLSFGTGSVTVNANLIQGNLAGSGLGGGIYASFVNGQDMLSASIPDYTLDIFNNMIVDNMAGYTGGGIFLEDTVNARIINNTISRNDSTATGANAFFAGTNPDCAGALAGTCSVPQGAGLVANMNSADLQAVVGLNTFSNPTLQNNIFWQNRSFYYDARQGNNVLGGLVLNPSTTAPVSNGYWDLQVFGDTTGLLKLNPLDSVLTNITGYNGAGANNTQGDPLFNAPYFNQLLAAAAPGEGGNQIQVIFTPLTITGDYHIRSGSSAIDQGSNAAITGIAELSKDYDGQNRPNGGVDSGADERYNSTTFTITSSAGANGTIAPLGTVVVAQGGNQTYVITPNVGYHVTNLVVDGSPAAGCPTACPDIYSFTNVQTNHTINATFAINQYTITPTAGPNGTITPATPQTVNHGGSVSFSIHATTAGYRIGDVLVDGASVGPITTDPFVYTFTNVTANHSIDATFVPDTFTIIASVSPGGTMSPSGNLTLNRGATQAFTMVPLTGYHFVDVIVDGASVFSSPALVTNPDGSKTYTFTNIQTNHTLLATFVINGAVLINASYSTFGTPIADTGGTMTPSGFLTVNSTSSQTFFFAVNPGYRILDVVVDGSSVCAPDCTALTSYTFNPVNTDRSIAVTFISNEAWLVRSYYLNILNRLPEPGGVEGWVAEIDRIVSLGIDVKEGFIAVSRFFFGSDEYLAQNNTDSQYVTDLYAAFLQRTPSQAEIDYWVGLMGQGMSRGIALNYFVYSPEFKLYMDGVLGPSSSRPENNLVNDFYRGFLNRLPDSGGFNSFLSLMRQAQCQGVQQVRDLSNQIALAFVQSAEYALRNRTDAQFVADLYDGILRRGALPSEVNYWVTFLSGNTRAQTLPYFTSSSEFQGRVTEVINAGCIL